MEVDVNDAACKRGVLDLLDEGHAADSGAGILDFELNEDVFPKGVGEDVGDIPGTDLEGKGFLLAPVDDCGDQALAFEFVSDGAANVSAGASGEFDLFCHG